MGRPRKFTTEYYRHRDAVKRKTLRQELSTRLAEGWHLQRTRPDGGGACWHFEKGTLAIPAWLFKEMIVKGYWLNRETGFYEPPEAA